MNAAHDRGTDADREAIRTRDRAAAAKSSGNEAHGGAPVPVEIQALVLTGPRVAPEADGPRKGEVLQDLQRRSGNAAVQRLVAQTKQGDPAHDYPLSEEMSRRVRAAKGRGRALEPDTRAGMEEALGRGLGDVRVHTGPGADRLARSVKAEAFTAGVDIFFREGNYAPGTPEGLGLLAHEIGHVARTDAAASSRRVFRQAEGAVAPVLAPAVAPAVAAASGALAAASLAGEDTAGQGGVRTQMRYKVVVEGREFLLTPEEYSVQRERALKVVKLYHERILTYTKDAERSHDNFMENVHGKPPWISPVAMIADQIGGVWPPPIQMWKVPQAVLDASLASIATGDLATAVRQIEQAEKLYNECYRIWYTYRMGTISGAETAKKGLEITRDVSFGIAASIGAAALLPVLVPAGAAASTTLITGAGLQAAGAGVATLLGSGTTVGAASVMGEREALGPEYDPLTILKKAGTNAVTAFMGALIGGALSPLFQKALGGQITNLSDEALAEISKAAGPGVEVTRDFFATWAQRELAEFLADIPANVMGEAVSAAIEYMETGKKVSPEEFVKRVALQLLMGAGSRQTIGRVAARQQVRRTAAAAEGPPSPGAAPEAAAAAAPTPPVSAPTPAPSAAVPGRLPPSEPPLTPGLPPTLPPPGRTLPGMGPPAPEPALPSRLPATEAPLPAAGESRLRPTEPPAPEAPGGARRPGLRPGAPGRPYELVRSITDVGEAQALRDRFILEGRALHSPPNRQTYRDEWNLVLGRAGDPPPAFITSNGELHIDLDRVGWAPEGIYAAAWALRPPAARGAARGAARPAGAPPPAGAGTTGRIPTGEAPTVPVPESHAPTLPAPGRLPPTEPPPTPGLPPTLPPPGRTFPGMGPPAPALAHRRSVPDNGIIRGERVARALRDRAIMQGEQPEFYFDHEFMQAEWNALYGRTGDVPPAFITDDGVLHIDYKRLGDPPREVMEAWVRGPAGGRAGAQPPTGGPPTPGLPPTLPPPGGTLPGMGPGPTLPPPGTTLRGLGPAAPRPGALEYRYTLARRITDVREAQALRDRFVLEGLPFREIPNPEIMREEWNLVLGQAGDPPPAFITSTGEIQIDTNRVGWVPEAVLHAASVLHPPPGGGGRGGGGAPPPGGAGTTGRIPTGEAPTAPVPESHAPTLPAGGSTTVREPIGEAPTLPAVRPPGVMSGEFRPLSVSQLNELFFRCFKRHLRLTEADVVVITDSDRWRQEWVASRGRLEEADAVPAFADISGRIFVNGAQPELFLLRFHEAIHRHAVVTGGGRFQRRYGAFLEEGLTEWLTRLHLGPQATRTGYDRNVRFLEWIMERGVSPEVLERAYLDGDLDTLRAALLSAFGGDLSVVLRFESALREVGRLGTNAAALKDATYIVRTGKEPEESV